MDVWHCWLHHARNWYLGIIFSATVRHTFSGDNLCWYTIAMRLHGIAHSSKVASSVMAASQGQASTRHPGWMFQLTGALPYLKPSDRRPEDDNVGTCGRSEHRAASKPRSLHSENHVADGVGRLGVEGFEAALASHR